MPIDPWPAVIAPFVGSFLGVLVYRLPRGEPIGISRSRCESCGRGLLVRDMVPVVSFVALRGRCRWCGEALPLRLPAIELAATGVALSAALAGGGVQLWFDCGLGWGLLTLAWIDWDWMILPDLLTVPLLLLGLCAASLDGLDSLLLSLAGALLGWGAFAGIAWAYRGLRGRDGLGGGDAKLLAVAGAWIGPDLLPWVVVLAAGGAGAWMVSRSRWRGRPVAADGPFAFGPWLALSIWLLRLIG